MSPHYSLTEATELFLKHYPFHQETAPQMIRKYNTHKIRHTFWVLETWRNLIIKIKERLEISKELSNKAEMVFLFHDLARFTQNDGVSVLPEKVYEHGDHGYTAVKKAWFDETICLAIKYHNKRRIDQLFEEPTYLSMTTANQDMTLILTHLVRDADKLQNMVFSLFYPEGLTWLSPELENGDITPEVIKDLEAKVTVNRDYIRSVADYILSLMSWSFDLYFPESVEMLEYYKYFEKTLGNLSKLEWVSMERLHEAKKCF